MKELWSDKCCIFTDTAVAPEEAAKDIVKGMKKFMVFSRSSARKNTLQLEVGWMWCLTLALENRTIFPTPKTFSDENFFDVPK